MRHHAVPPRPGTAGKSLDERIRRLLRTLQTPARVALVDDDVAESRGPAAPHARVPLQLGNRPLRLAPLSALPSFASRRRDAPLSAPPSAPPSAHRRSMVSLSERTSRSVGAQSPRSDLTAPKVTSPPPSAASVASAGSQLVPRPLHPRAFDEPIAQGLFGVTCHDVRSTRTPSRWIRRGRGPTWCRPGCGSGRMRAARSSPATRVRPCTTPPAAAASSASAEPSTRRPPAR